MSSREAGDPGSGAGEPSRYGPQGSSWRDDDDPLSSHRSGEAPPRSEPQPGPATGGHLPPDTGAGGPLFDPLLDPLPSEVEAARTSVVPAGAEPPRARPSPRPGSDRRRRVAVRRVRRTLRHVDPMSVLKVSLFFYACFLVLWLVFVAIVYAILSSAGFFDAIEEFGGPQGLVVWQRLDITLFFVERWAFLLGLTFAIGATLVNVFLAFLYNVAADTVGGVEMTFVEREH